MPALFLQSPNQIASTAGRAPRVALADALQNIAPLAVANREFAQQQRALELQEQAQARAQSGQTTGNIISGVGTVGQGALTLKQLGLFSGAGGGTSAGTGVPLASAAGSADLVATSGAAATVPELAAAAPTIGAAGLEGGAAALAVEGAGTGAAATSGGLTGALAVEGAGTGAAATSGGLTGALGAAAPIVGAAGIGLAGGALAGPPVRRLAGGGAGGRLAGASAGALIGAAGGFLIGGPIGALAGGVVGGLSGAFCVIHEASYGADSLEVAIARQFRDQHLTREQLRAYYFHFAPVAEKMHQDSAYRMHVRTALVDRLVRVGAERLGVAYARPSAEDRHVAAQFLQRLAVLGKDMPAVSRPDGSVI